VGVNHGRGEVLVPEELLDAADIISVLQQMRSKTVPESMAARGFGYGGRADGVFDGILQVPFREMMATLLAAARID